MITAWAGKLTPQAKVAVQTSTFIYPLVNNFSIILRSCLANPAWWMPNPYWTRSYNSLFRIECACEIFVIQNVFWNKVFHEIYFNNKRCVKNQSNSLWNKQINHKFVTWKKTNWEAKKNNLPIFCPLTDFSLSNLMLQNHVKLPEKNYFLN